MCIAPAGAASRKSASNQPAQQLDKCLLVFRWVRASAQETAAPGVYMGSYCVGENYAPVYWNVKLKQRALELLAHDSVLGVARRAKTFRPVEANTGDRAADTFVLR